MPRDALVRLRQRVARFVEELQVLLAREGTERPGMQASAPLAAAVNLEALAVAGDLAGEGRARRERENEGGRCRRTDDSSHHAHTSNWPTVGARWRAEPSLGWSLRGLDGAGLPFEPSGLRRAKYQPFPAIRR